ncbi:hypothetical protein [Stigmatella aurantiaca]|uniref:Uncharacterized protein n=1 Tax=Stigmatella aurantiaca (strain DW4/3-1) TaxID=378806 RepID=Q08XF3_STIAD|nr:hypothetical protein [Stigmatella aurantiaca]ADO70682.1 uncharacterized protein STAUR_2890 [Stigmatella aurantiaca DW4/3-1]EAU65172.1 hypothetical protein STIAU_4198 [Stigmatella aurantiaca DW4/3-1]
MFGQLLLWVRRNSRKALALALAPGLVALAFDSAVSHWAGKDFDNRWQAIPVVYGVVGFILLTAMCIPKSRTVFSWTARLVGGAGVLVGVVGTYIHATAFFKELGGDYSAANLEGALSVAPPLLAPLSFVGVGALLALLPSAKLLFRLRVGVAPVAQGAGGALHHLEEGQERARAVRKSA